MLPAFKAQIHHRFPCGKSGSGIHNNDFWQKIRSMPNFANIIKTSISYAFSDIDPMQIASISHKVIDEALTFNQVCELLYDWYASLEDIDIIGFTKTNAEHQRNKAVLSGKPIKQLANSSKLDLFDIGTGDGLLTSGMSRYLRDCGYSVNAVRVDMHDDIDWASSDEHRAAHKGMKQVYYDGSDLESVLKHELASKTDDSTIVVTYNHALHHWPTPAAQINSIAQLSASLPDGSIVVFKEHFNIMDDDNLALNHALINFRITFGSKARSKDATSFKEAAANSIDQYIKHSGAHNFMSAFWLITVMQNHGFQLATFTPQSSVDPDKTVVYGFVKRALQTKRIRSSIDDLDALMMLKGINIERLAHDESITISDRASLDSVTDDSVSLDSGCSSVSTMSCKLWA